MSEFASILCCSPLHFWTLFRPLVLSTPVDELSVIKPAPLHGSFNSDVEDWLGGFFAAVCVVQKPEIVSCYQNQLKQVITCFWQIRYGSNKMPNYVFAKQTFLWNWATTWFWWQFKFNFKDRLSKKIGKNLKFKEQQVQDERYKPHVLIKNEIRVPHGLIRLWNQTLNVFVCVEEVLELFVCYNLVGSVSHLLGGVDISTVLSVYQQTLEYLQVWGVLNTTICLEWN